MGITMCGTSPASSLALALLQTPEAGAPLCWRCCDRDSRILESRCALAASHPIFVACVTVLPSSSCAP